MKRIVIKYSENDNISFSEKERGWVEVFADLLKISLPKFVKTPVELVLIDESKEITLQEFHKADIIMYILSPAFIFSSNINQEIPDLEKKLDFDISFINKKVKKVVKAPFPTEDLPMSLKVGPNYLFYHYTDENDSGYQSYEGWMDFHDNLPFWQIFSDLMYDIQPILDPAAKQEARNSKKVFLAPTLGGRFKTEREIIKRELKTHGIQILPDEDYSIESGYLNDPEGFYLDRAAMAIHFPDEFVPIEKKENRERLEKHPQLKRFIWFDPEDQADVSRQRGYTDLKINLKGYSNIEAIESPLEELKDIIKERFNLGYKANNKRDISLKDMPLRMLYLIAAPGSRDERYLELIKKIETLGWNVVENIIDDSGVSHFRRMHYTYLKNADYFMVYFENNNINWLESNVKEIVKAPGMSRNKPILGRGIYTELPPIFSDITFGGFSFINSDGTLGAITLEEFIKPDYN